MRSYLTLCLLAILLVQYASSDDGLFYDFVHSKLSNYTTWLQGFDPSPLESGPAYFYSEKKYSGEYNHYLHTTIENYGVKGHAGKMEIIGIGTDSYRNSFTVNFTVTGKTTYFGDYNLNGTFPHSDIIHSEGAWNITIPSVYYKLFTINLAVNPHTGKLMIFSFDLLFLTSQDYGYDDIFFENLLDQPVGNYSGMGMATLAAGFRSSYYTDTPGATRTLRRLYLQYWTEVLAETTPDDIFGMPGTPTK